MPLQLKTVYLPGVIFMLVLFCPLATPAGEGADFEGLKREIAALCAKTPGNASVGVAVMDVVSGEVVYALNGDAPLNPASNAKIVTAAAALKILGPEYRFTTELYGKVEGRGIAGPLYIKGHADPDLETADFRRMVTELKADGVRRVGGGVVVDDSFFDGENLPFAFDQQPDEDNRFRAPVGAVSLNQNAIAIRIAPGDAPMGRAMVSLDPPEYAVLQNDALTMSGGPFSPRISAAPFEDRTRIRVWGQVPTGTPGTWYYRRIDNPSLFAGYGLKGVLKDAGIAVGGDVRIGDIPPGTPLLARTTSEPLSSVLWQTGKMSNNFVTEMVLKTIGARAGKGPATWKEAIGAVESLLEEWGLPRGSYVYRNGSGLFDANRLSAVQFCRVLRAAYMDSTIRPEFLSQLATGGVDGTIESRYTEAESRRYVRAKTGTLDSVSALSGYVLDREGRHPVAFSVLVNDASGYVSAAREYQEKIVNAIARHLNR